MDLYEYLHLQKSEDREFRDVQFAKKCGMSRQHLSRIKSGLMTPGIKIAKIIEKNSNGLVNAIELINANYERRQQREHERHSDS